MCVVASRLFPSPVAVGQVALWIAAAGLALLIGWVAARPIRLFQAAVRADEALGLKERLSTALAIANPSSEPELAVVRDAAEYAARIQPRRVFPMDLAKELRRAAPPAAALALVWLLMPQFDLLARLSGKKPALAQAVAVETKKEAARRLEDLATEISQTAELRKPAIAQDLQKNLSALAKKLEDQKIAPEKAMADMAKMQDRIGARREEIEKNLAMANDLQSKGLGEHTRDIGEAMKKGNFTQAAKALDELKKKLQNNSLSEREKAAVQKELKALAAQMGKDSPLAKALGEASDKMADGQMNMALAGMEDAASQMVDMEAMLAELQALGKLEYDMKARQRALAGNKLCEGCKAGGT